ncbi:MAG: SIMPL domain-containing protein [Candidatus Gastranaerophilales bacterium]|nr:SIMPL domain-containing protein [Candidatus Gastranaerophilales bacterium]
MYEKLKDFQLTIVAIIIGIALIICSNYAADAIKREGVGVTGSAFKVVKSDVAILNLDIKAQNISKAAAYNKIRSQLPELKDYLISQGIKENEITIMPADSYPNYKINPQNGYTTNIVEFYNFNQTIQIKTNNVETVKILSTAAQSLLDKGIDLTVNPPEYYCSELNDIKVQLLKEATIDAKQRAAGMLSATNNKVGKIQSVKMGVFQVTPVDSTMVSDLGISDTSSIDKKITAVANVVFSIK